MIVTPPVEPLAAPWQARSIAGVLHELLPPEARPRRPTILAVDGRQGSGKSTLAARFAALDEGSALVPTDDVAWWESFFGWDQLMVEGVLRPLHLGADVDYRPPAWERRGREGSIKVPRDASLVIIEGVGSSSRALAPLLDVAVWVQSDFDEANRRGIARQGGSRYETDFWWEWDREEQPFLAQDRPWERADVILCGTPQLAGVGFDAATEVLVGRSLRP
jgi:hypothetical protein